MDFSTATGAVALYTGANAIILFALALNVGARRGKQGQLEPGATGDRVLVRAIRAHGNFTEYAPVVLLLLVMLALLGASAEIVHALGATFTLGRISHVFGMMQEKHPNAARFIGNLTTGLVLLAGAAACFWFAH